MKKIVGILGFGVVGRSYADFVIKYRAQIRRLFFRQHSDFVLFVWDKRVLTEEEYTFLAAHDVIVCSPAMATMKEFMIRCDAVLVSAGVDVQGLPGQAKCVTELDLFKLFYHKKAVAITGSLGKTTVTSLLSQTLSTELKALVPAIGNIGIPMLSILDTSVPMVSLELSSYQLERNTSFAPDVAVITSLYPNHLDRHSSLKAYFDAKWNITLFQSEEQVTVLTWSLFTGVFADYVKQAVALLKTKVFIVADKKLEPTEMAVIPLSSFTLLYMQNEQLFVHQVGILQKDIIQEYTIVLSDHIFPINQLVVIAVHLGLSLPMPLNLNHLALDQKYQPHRCEYVNTINQVDFYNDSKGTVTQATYAAVQKLLHKNRPVIVILGGLGKGVDRSSFARELLRLPMVKQVYAFGAERATFQEAFLCETLDQVLDHIFTIIQPGDQVLFSPSGSSFDLYKNYQHRGDVFKNLVSKRAGLYT